MSWSCPTCQLLRRNGPDLMCKKCAAGYLDAAKRFRESLDTSIDEMIVDAFKTAANAPGNHQ